MPRHEQTCLLGYRPSPNKPHDVDHDHYDIYTVALTYYYDPVILQNKLTPLSIFRDLALRKRDSKKFKLYFYVFYSVYTNIQK